MFNSVYGTLQYLLDYTAVKPILIRLQIKKKQYTGIIMECDYKNTVATIISVWQGSITQSVFLGRPGYKTRIQGHRLFCSGHSSLINLDRMALCQVYISTCQCLFCLSQGSLLPTWSSALVCQNLKYSMFFLGNVCSMGQISVDLYMHALNLRYSLHMVFYNQLFA